MASLRVVALVSALAATMTSAFAAPAYAHSYPDPGGHQWQLIKEEKVRYFVPGSQTTGEPTRERINSKLLSSEVEKRNETSGDSKEPESPIIKQRDETRPAGRRTENRKAGRYVNSFDLQKFETYRLTHTTIPYKIYEIQKWEERVNSLLANTYRVTRKLEWEDPFSKEVKAGTAVYDEGPIEETSSSAWVARTKKTFKSDGKDESDKEDLINTKVTESRLGSALTAAQDFNDAAADARNVGAFSGSKGRGSTQAFAESTGAQMALSGADRSRAKGGTAASRPSHELLLKAAKDNADLMANGSKAWKLVTDGKEIGFIPYDSAGNLVSDQLTLKLDKFTVAGKAGLIQIDGYDAGNGGLAVLGKFDNKYQPGKGVGRLTVAK
ncbi:MAG: hypothetical protein FJZ00_09325 [Candidatus Sericytochromatia bacterium]|uniref:Uncharacterized protein n=1 Tax=Candidatus Tanganyikabacteria bacterium TaxID=2961651 RepID=A0A938BJH8_9BACT|nr:hypothetical protein [Candidatus Tanganyikabacteria bacterium]